MATTVTNEISIAGPLTNIPQPLQDEGENRSALQIGTTQVVVTAPQLAPGQQPFALDVHGQAWTANRPCMQIESDSNEASLRFVNKADNTPWHIGTGGGAGLKNFFIWNQDKGIVVTIRDDGSVIVNGSLVVDALKAEGEIKLNAEMMLLSGMKQAPQPPSPGALRPILIDPASGRIFYQ